MSLRTFGPSSSHPRQARCRGARPVATVLAVGATVVKLALTCFALGVPAVEAQPGAAVPRVGVLSGGPDKTKAVEAFRAGLRELGWIEGQNVVVEYRFGEGDPERLPVLARELIDLRVEVIAAGPTPPALAARNATRSIPIVMMGASEPVELGLVSSLARPGGNITGVSWSVNLEIIGKNLEILKEVLPRLRKVAVLWSPSSPAQATALKQLAASARSAGVELVVLGVRGAEEFDDAFAAMAKQRVDALLVVPDALFGANRARLAMLEARYRLPSVHGLLQNVEAGGLLFYGPDLPAIYRRGAQYVDRVLRGAKPGDLPVELPTKYEMAINLKTAKALGLTIPHSLMLRADQILE